MTAPMQTGSVQCANPLGLHRMRYTAWGHPDQADVLVCVHGLTRQGRDFDILAQAMQSRFRVICPDVVGRGQSDWLPAALAGQAYQLPQYVADMVTLLAYLQGAGAQRIHWVGTSMGGLIGLLLAGMANSPIRSLILNDVGPTLQAPALERIADYLGPSPQWPTEQAASDALWELSAGFGPHSAEQRLALSRPQIKPLNDTPNAPWVNRYDPAIATAFKQWDPVQAQQGEAILWHSFDAIQCPTLVLRGAESDLLTPATLHAMQTRGPKASAHTFSGVGHAPTLVQDDQVQCVRQFLLDQLSPT